MGVTPASPAGGGGTSPRIYGPRTLENEFHTYKKKEEIRPVLAKIERIYSQVKLDKEKVMGNAFCFGLLDPATNILVNSAISKAKAPAAPPAAGGRRRGGGKPPAARDMNQWSLDGLIAFLTCLFPYLPDAEALGYLDAAALLVIRRRGMRRFGFCSGITIAAVETALRCAAVAANYPDPHQLVLAWKQLSRGLTKFVSETASNKPDTVARHVLSMVNFNGASDTNLQLKEAWELAERRLDDNPIAIRKELPPARAAAKRMLLATIHGLYLQALARLPTAELISRYHRSLLMGGYCYGPLDPVSNIIVNTVWYDQKFPSSKQVTLQMISTSCLWRVTARSLYGLVSFLCTRYPSLTPDQALQRLLVTGANLKDADPNLFDMPDKDSNLRSESDIMQIGPGNPDTCEMYCSAKRLKQALPSTSVPEAYAAAATAAFHDNPLVQKEFLGSPDVVSKLMAASEVLRLQDGHPLSSQDLEFLSMSLLEGPSSTSKSCPQQDLAPIKVKMRVYTYRSRCSSRFWGQHERVSSMVKAACLHWTNSMRHRLHIICGANEFVSGPEPCFDEKVGDYNPWTPHKYYHTHINFVAVSEGYTCDPPKLFFAECGKDGVDTCWCIPVTPQKPDAEQVRCIYCEHEGNRIVHPAMGSFHGRDEFDREVYTNDKVITDKSVSVDQVHALEDDAIYQNCCVVDDGDDSDSDAHYWIDIC
ncbi:unnamed protein product [Urochloa humidicola]